MLRTRLWMGAILIGLAVGVLVFDQYWAPAYPFLLVLLLSLSSLGCFELLHLLPRERRPVRWLCYVSAILLILANWPAHVGTGFSFGDRDPWHWILGTFAALVLAAILLEMALFQRPGHSLERISLLLLVAIYLGFLPCFLAQMRWLGTGHAGSGVPPSTVAMALAIFVPKGCDIGAYFTGRLLGRHRMSAILSPKKTWEGAAGGLVASAAVAVALDRLGSPPVLQHNLALEVGFGLTVGLAGMLGDLAESLIKRDCEQKDASQVVPGFGGVLDVVDSVVFAAPVAFGYLKFFSDL